MVMAHIPSKKLPLDSKIGSSGAYYLVKRCYYGHMNLARKLIAFLVIFSIAFYFIRTSDAYNTEILLADLGGVTWFYSVIGTIFGMLAAFAIQQEWSEWNALINAVRREVDSLEKTISLVK